MDDEISPAELHELLEQDESVTVVDIRQPAAFDRGHIPDSVNIPFPELPNRVDELADADHIVAVCPHGKSSVQAARIIQSYEGTEADRVESMAGGLDEWEWELTSETQAADEGPQSPF